MRYARTNTQHECPAGSTLSLVTWTQREDSRCYDARIPDGVKAVEFVFVEATAGARRSYSYQEFEGTPLKNLSSEQGPTPSGRAAHLLSQRAAVMPDLLVEFEAKTRESFMPAFTAGIYIQCHGPSESVWGELVLFPVFGAIAVCGYQPYECMDNIGIPTLR